MAKAVVNGAVLKCSNGTIPSNLSGASGLFSIGGAMVATVNDHAASNLGTFGICAFDQQPCIPACSSPWPGSASIRTGAPLLSSRAQLVCNRVGVISIVDPGQTTLNVGEATEVELFAKMFPGVFRTMTPEEVRAAIAARKAELRTHGLDPKDTDLFDTLTAIGTIMAHRELIDRMARRYGIPPALLAGVVASEMDFDESRWNDRAQDWVGRHLHLPVGQGQGVGSVHEATLRAATVYLYQHQLPGSTEALARLKGHLFDPGSSARFPNSVEEAAIAASMYHHAHGGTSTPTDMAVVWGGYRTGVDGVSPGGGGYSHEGFKQNEVKDSERLPGRLKVGKNAYMSEPMFEYFQQVFR